jgi:hypothetical protein
MRSNDLFTGYGCILMAVFLFVNLFVGAWSVNYLLMEFMGKQIPLLGAMVIGLFAGEVSIPVAVVVLILKACGVL